MTTPGRTVLHVIQNNVVYAVTNNLWVGFQHKKPKEKFLNVRDTPFTNILSCIFELYWFKDLISPNKIDSSRKNYKGTLN
jgi:hypothetical protein